MNVNALAAQTFSNNIATVLEQLFDKHKDFLGCAPTIKFVKTINDIFDYLNSRSFIVHGCNIPITLDTAEKTFQSFLNSITYLSGIKLDNKPILQSKLKTGFLGFIIDIQNLQKIYVEYISNNYLKYILLYKFSQDYL